MIDPAEIADKLVVLLREIPEYLEEMAGDPERIYAYHDAYPAKKSLDQAIYEMPVPATMVVWQGTAPGNFGGAEVWEHKFSVIIRARESPTGMDPPTGYYRLFRLFAKGVPASGTQVLQYATVHPSCHPMNTPGVVRQSDVEGLDYFEISVSFTEIGDE